MQQKKDIQKNDCMYLDAITLLDEYQDTLFYTDIYDTLHLKIFETFCILREQKVSFKDLSERVNNSIELVQQYDKKDFNKYKIDYIKLKTDYLFNVQKSIRQTNDILELLKLLEQQIKLINL